jgi:hypothetical protein
MSALARPPGLESPAVDGVTSTVRPAAVSALVVSGEAVTDAPNGRCSQPEKPTGFALPSCVTNVAVCVTLGSFHPVMCTVIGWGAPQAVGRVRNGAGTAPDGQFSLRHRHASWLGSPGTPHRLMIEPMAPRDLTTFLMRVVTP